MPGSYTTPRDASQAIEFGDHQFVPLLQRLQVGTQLGAFLNECTGGHLLGKDLLAPSGPPFSDLGGGVLVSDRNAARPSVLESGGVIRINTHILI